MAFAQTNRWWGNEEIRQEVTVTLSAVSWPPLRLTLKLYKWKNAVININVAKLFKNCVSSPKVVRKHVINRSSLIYVFLNFCLLYLRVMIFPFFCSKTNFWRWNASFELILKEFILLIFFFGC